MIEVRLPADLVAGTEFVTSVALDLASGREGSVQLEVSTTKPERESGLLPIAVTESLASGPWTSNNHRLAQSAPIVVNPTSAARHKIELAFDQFRQVFPLALCYTKIVPVDEVVTLTLYYREDEPLVRLMLSDEEARRLNRLWEELHYLSRDPLKSVDAFLQLLEYASQDADPKVFEPMRKPIYARAAAFKKVLLAAEPKQVDALIDFAARAYRRPLAESESNALRDPLSPAAARRAFARGGFPVHVGPHFRLARFPLSARGGSLRSGARPRFGLGTGQPLELFPLVVPARCRAAKSRRQRDAA